MLTRLPIALTLLLMACGGVRTPTSTPDDVIAMEEMRIVAQRGEGELVFDSYDAGQLFERGTRLLNEGQCRDAVSRYYDRIAAEFPTSRYLAPSMYNAGLCLHEGGEAEASIPYYERVLEVAPSSRDGKHAALQLAQVLIGLERWERAHEVVNRALLRDDLNSAERLEGLARRAQALLGLERLVDAERQARDALSYFRTRRGDDAIADPYFAAAANFVLAETMRRRSEALTVPEGTAQMQHEVLDARARLVLDAQREYFSTIRFTDAHWAAAAGYRIGSMYDALWEAMMEAPVPPPAVEMNEATRELYRTEYRIELGRHIRPLIRHAIRYWELTLMMIERTGVQTEWAERTRGDLERMRGRLLANDDPAPSSDATVEERLGPTSRMPRLPLRLRGGDGGTAARAFSGTRAPDGRATRAPDGRANRALAARVPSG